MTTSLNAALARLDQDASLGADAGHVDRIARLRNGSASAEDWSAAATHLLRIDPAMALAVLEHALNTHAREATLHYLKGNALRMLGQAQAAESSLRTAIAMQPAHADASFSLAFLLREQGRMNALVEVMLDLWNHAPRTLQSDQRILFFLCECGRYADAARLLPALLAAYPDHVEIARRAGEVAMVLGQFEDAGKHLRRALALNPHQPSAWLRLAHTHRFSADDDPDLGLLRSARARTDLDADAQSAIRFALGKALDDLQRFGEASEVLAEANRNWRAARPWNPAAFLASVEKPLRPRAVAQGKGEEGVIPLFIVGLPRAGTTLLETLLSCDSAVRSRGELNWIDALAARLDDKADAATVQAAGSLYLRQLIQDDAPARVYIDKNPLNFRYLGLIAAMLPQARVIHLKRNLCATALSLWSQHFAHEAMAWSYSFDDIARFARGYRKLMTHWLAAPPLPIFELDYETLVSDPDTAIASVRGFLQLPAGSAPANATSTAPIATASVWQARQQVHTRSIERWRRYAEFLPALTEMQTMSSPSPAGGRGLG